MVPKVAVVVSVRVSRPETVLVEVRPRVTAPASEPAVAVEPVNVRLADEPAVSSLIAEVVTPATVEAVTLRLSW